MLPEAVARLVAAGHDVSLDLIGPTIGLIGDQEADAIRDEARRLGVADRVNLRGPVALDQLMSLYRDYDIFVLPTRPGEGIPRVLLEAMAGGLPIVTTHVSGIASLITNGRERPAERRLDDGGCRRCGKTPRDAVAAPASDSRGLRHGAGAHAGASGRRDDEDCGTRVGASRDLAIV